MSELPEVVPAPTRTKRALLTLALVALIALIGMLDYWTGTEIALSIFFLIPIGIGAWFLGARTGSLLACLSSAAWLLAERNGGFPYSNSAIPYWNALVGLGFYLIIAAALSARRRTEQRILELMNIKSEFTAMVSHELRTPLTCIKEGIDLVSDGSCGPLNPDQHEHLQTAKRNVDRLSRLLNDVLEYQKLGARRVRLRRELCDLNVLCEQAVEQFSLAAAKKGLVLEAELDPGIPIVQGDPDRITQVIDNLLSNALKFTEQGRIRVSSACAPEGVRIAVRDTGMGIAREDLPRLFRAFTQFAPPRKRREGTGLGLAIARQIVELHGGRIEVESTPGSGSTFSFVLPESAPLEQAPSALLDRGQVPHPMRSR